MTRFRASLLHPVLAVVFLPSRKPAVAELQEQPVVMIDQPAAAEIAEREIDFTAGRAGDVLQRLLQRRRHLRDVHAEHQRAVVRHLRVEGRPSVQRCALRARLPDREKDGRRQQRECCEISDHHARHYAALAFGKPSRNGSTASMNACGWSMLTAWPAAGITSFCAPGIFAAM